MLQNGPNRNLLRRAAVTFVQDTGRSIAAGFCPGEESPDNAGRHTT